LTPALEAEVANRERLKMNLSRRQFFERIRHAAEGPQRWREKRMAQLKDYALKKAPTEWTPEQREEAGRAIERRLAYMSDDSLRGSAMRRYVESILHSKDLFYQATQAEQDYYRDQDSSYDDYSG